MLSLRVAETDEDLEAWRRVRVVVEPGERSATVAELRSFERPGRVLLLAEDDGVLVGTGVTDRSDVNGGFVCPRVLPEARRRGYGTQILLELARLAQANGHTVAACGVESPEALAFAERFGFVEVDRQVEQLRQVGEEPDPLVPAGVEIVCVADRPELWEQAYHGLHETFADMALTSTIKVTLAEWERDWINAPEAAFVAVVDGQVVGVASLMLDSDQPARAENGYTAVRREHRGRGIAKTLKQTTLAWAAAHGITEVYTWTQKGNDDMRATNERLGYTYGAVSIRVEAPLPLTQP